MSAGVEFVEVHKGGVLRGVSFDTPTASVTALVGAAGAGKSTVFRLIAGLDRPDAGAVLISGRDVSRARRGQLRRIRRGMAVMFQEGDASGFGLFDSATMHENVAYAVRTAGRSSARRSDGHVLEYLERLGLAGHAGARPSELSPELRKRLALARALALRAPLVVLDDFDGGLEPGVAGDLCELVREERGRRGAQYFLTTRDAAVADRVADHVLVLERGRLGQSPRAGEPGKA